MGLVSKTNGDGSYIFENKGMVSKKVQNFDEVADILLVTFFSTNCHLGFIVNHMKENITIMVNLVDCAIRTISAKIKLYVGYKAFILTQSSKWYTIGLYFRHLI